MADQVQTLNEPQVHIILCAYQPNLTFFEIQICSIIAQTFHSWTCEICVDCGDLDQISEIKAIASRDPRFSVSERAQRLGVYHNFEAGLNSAPDADYIAYCDQDDEWVPEKLAKSLASFEKSTSLVHSDLEVIGPDGTTIYRSCFDSEKRLLDDFSLGQLVLRNSITGCTCVFRADIKKHLLPFPEQGLEVAFHHDLWTALVAAQCGEIRAIFFPLVRYRQHGGNVVGVEAARSQKRSAPFLLQARAWISSWRLRDKLITEVLARQIPDRHPSAEPQRLEIAQWIRNRPFDWSLLKRTFTLLVRGYPAGEVALHTTLGKALTTVLVLRRGLNGTASTISYDMKKFKLVLAALRRFLFSTAFRAKVYDALTAKAGQHSELLLSADGPQFGEQYLAPLSLTFTALRPRVVIVVPTARKDFIFGGLTTVFKFGVALASRGIPIRFVSTEHFLTDEDVSELRGYLSEQCGFEGNSDLIAIATSVGSPVEANRFDVFVATIWWTARRVFQTLKYAPFEMKEFYYFIQDYEPGFYAWSNEFALAESTYLLPCRPIVNTQFLADYLRKETGLFTPSDRVFNPEIEWKRFHPPAFEEMKARRRGQIFFYGRPGTPRNLFDVGVAALRRFVLELGLLDTDIEVVSAGEKHEPISLGNNVVMQSLGKLGMEAYAEALRQADVGLSLMLSPHPSYPPFEMAASGMTVVTNNFGTKRMSFGDNIIASRATPEEIVGSLMKAWERRRNAAGRIAGARIDTSSLGRPLRDLVPELAVEMAQLLKTSEAKYKKALRFSNSSGLQYVTVSGENLTFVNERVCLFSQFDIDNKVDKHVLNYLAALKSEGFKLILISSNLDLDNHSRADVERICDVVILRENLGYDFAGWALAMELFPSLFDAEQILLTNDSVYGPMTSLGPIFRKMRADFFDLWGITESREVEWHLQSYFLVFEKAAISSEIFRLFWGGVKAYKNKRDIILRYEVPLARIFSSNGLLVGALVHVDSVSAEICNPTLNHWRALLKFGAPFIKVELLRDNPLQTNVNNWTEVVQRMGYDPKLIRDHLSRIKRIM